MAGPFFTYMKGSLTKVISLLLAVLMSAAACNKEPLEEDTDASWQYPFAEFMRICFSGGYYCGTFADDDCVTFTFTGDKSVSIPRSDLKIVDCTIFDTPEFGERNGCWTINMVQTDFKVDKSRPIENSWPVCIYYDDNCVSVFFSNGKTFIVGKDPSGALSSFAFLTRENHLLTKSIICGIDGTDVKGVRPVNIATLTLIPSFEYTGKSIKVDGVEQTSGESKQNFANPVQYDIELYDGSTVSYTVSLESGNSFPTVYIYTKNNAQIQKGTYVSGSIRIEDPKHRYSNEADLDTTMRIKGRGNATWGNFPKKPYHIKLDEKAKVFGLPKNKDWVLLANYSDKSLLRNEVAMEISKICGMPWTPTFYPVEVYLNGKYNGVYDFGDHKEVANHRVDITVVTDKDNSGDAVTGGYYFEIEQQLDEPVSWSTTMGVPMMFKDPEHPTKEQQNYVKSYFNDFEKALQSSSFTDPNTGYQKYIDVSSFIDYYIVQELTKNIDGNLRKSTFITKERGGKLKMYHVWDFDFALGNCDYFGSYYGISGGGSDFFIKDFGYQGYGWGWYYRLFQDNNFKLKVKNRWNQVKTELRDRIPAFIDEQSQYISEYADRNFEVWPILDTYVWPNRRIPGSYAGEVEYLRSWYLERFNWLDTEINKW